VVVVDGDAVELPDTDPLDVADVERPLVLDVPAVLDDVTLGDDVVVSLALLGSVVKCLRNGSLLSSWSRRFR
jgi:hypothetical protein